MNRRPRLQALSALAAGGALLLVACGTSDGAREGSTPSADADGSASSGQSAVADVEGCDDDETATSSDPVSLTDDLGRTVELDRPAERVVSLEWQQTEGLLTLCVAPVAVADVAGYNTWVSAAPLDAETADVGTRGEASLDAIAQADPDLVIMEVSDENDETLTKLDDAGIPVLATVGADAADPVANMKDLFTLIAESTGRTERAEEVLADFDETLAEGRQEIADAQLPTTEFVYFDGWVDGGNVAIRPFGSGSIIGAIGEELGLSDAWTGETDPVYGLGQTDIEGLREAGDAMLLHTTTTDAESDIMPQVEQNRVWQSLPAVEDGRVYGFPAGIWTFGGPLSSEQIVDAYVDLLAD